MDGLPPNRVVSARRSASTSTTCASAPASARRDSGEQHAGTADQHRRRAHPRLSVYDRRGGACGRAPPTASGKVSGTAAIAVPRGNKDMFGIRTGQRPASVRRLVAHLAYRPALGGETGTAARTFTAPTVTDQTTRRPISTVASRGHHHVAPRPHVRGSTGGPRAVVPVTCGSLPHTVASRTRASPAPS